MTDIPLVKTHWYMYIGEEFSFSGLVGDSLAVDSKVNLWCKESGGNVYAEAVIIYVESETSYRARRL